MDNPNPNLHDQVSNIVANYVSHNTVAVADLPSVISTVYQAVSGLGNTEVVVPAESLRPAVPIRKSVTPEYLICLEDGKKLKMLKRHLRSTYNLTPDEYRERWGLAQDYPMVAPNYAEQRSVFAKQIGLGHRRETTSAAPRSRGGRPLGSKNKPKTLAATA